MKDLYCRTCYRNLNDINQLNMADEGKWVICEDCWDEKLALKTEREESEFPYDDSIELMDYNACHDADLLCDPELSMKFYHQRINKFY